MTELTDFLVACLDEDEAKARGMNSEVATGPIEDVDAWPYLGILPGRVLREVEAKRRIVQRYLAVNSHRDGRAILLKKDVLDLAAVYSDRPGWHEEWRR